MSQKRIYFSGAIYFVTVKTKDNYPYFEERIFCDLWIEELKLCKRIKQFELIAFCLLHDHFHMMVRPHGKGNISQIMQFLKRHFSRSANWLLECAQEDDIRECRLQDGNYRNLENIIKNHDEEIKILKIKFLQKYKSIHEFPKFEWQKSFYDHFIRNDHDYDNHWDYTVYNYLKHELPKNWRYTSLNFPDLIDEFYS